MRYREIAAGLLTVVAGIVLAFGDVSANQWGPDHEKLILIVSTNGTAPAPEATVACTNHDIYVWLIVDDWHDDYQSGGKPIVPWHKEETNSAPTVTITPATGWTVPALSYHSDSQSQKKLILRSPAHKPSVGGVTYKLTGAISLQATSYKVDKDGNRVSVKGTETKTLTSGAKQVTVLKVDLDAMKVSHNAANGELPEDQETNPGAFVPINNDDDDYDASNTADKDQSGAISGESDLLPIKLHKVEPAITGSKYTLDIPTQVKVWQNPDRSGTVSGTTEFDATVDTTLYVEGFTVGSANIKINWKSGTTTLDDCDEIKVTIYDWSGPLNVPGYAIYRYTASGALGTSKWIAPSSGTIKTGTDTSDVTILWDGGPVVGKAIYQANADYIWDLEVNVVQVKIKQTGNSAAYNSTPFQVGGAGGAVIKASSQANCMTANVVVEKVEGPTVSSAQRGKKFMELGLVHQASFDAKHGLYNDTTPKKRRRSSLQDGQTHWDAAAAGTIPWVFTDTDHYLNITSDATSISDKEFKTFDNPQISCTDQFTLGGDQVDVLAPNMFHVLYLAVRAKQNVNSSHDVIAQRCKLNWRFNGTGGVDGTGAWALTGSGVTGDASFSEIQSGDNVPSAAANINEAFSTQTWTTENQ